MKDLWGFNNSDIELKCITYADGYWVVGGRYNGGGNYYARISAYDTRDFELPNISVDRAYAYIKAKE